VAFLVMEKRDRDAIRKSKNRLCLKCGCEYVFTGSRQKYCKSCGLIKRKLISKINSSKPKNRASHKEYIKTHSQNITENYAKWMLNNMGFKKPTQEMIEQKRLQLKIRRQIITIKQKLK
jgi:hypothetical protein